MRWLDGGRCGELDGARAAGRIVGRLVRRKREMKPDAKGFGYHCGTAMKPMNYK